jgi:hypothetical protein
MIIFELEAIHPSSKSARQAKEFIYVALCDLLDIAAVSIIRDGEIETPRVCRLSRP